MAYNLARMRIPRRFPDHGIGAVEHHGPQAPRVARGQDLAEEGSIAVTVVVDFLDIQRIENKLDH